MRHLRRLRDRWLDKWEWLEGFEPLEVEYRYSGPPITLAMIEPHLHQLAKDLAEEMAKPSPLWKLLKEKQDDSVDAIAYGMRVIKSDLVPPGQAFVVRTEDIEALARDINRPIWGSTDGRYIGDDL